MINETEFTKHEQKKMDISNELVKKVIDWFWKTYGDEISYLGSN